MKRRKFLQILGLTAVAPAAVLACPPVHNPWSKPKPKFMQFKEGGEITIRFLKERDHDKIVYYNHVSHDFAFPNKPIFPNYMTTNA